MSDEKTDGSDSVIITTSHKTVFELAEEQIQISQIKKDDRHFLICDLGDIINKYRKWTKLLPRVKPFYAIKCLDELPVLKLLRDCGASFDCASKSEMKKVLSLGVSPDRIIYAHPCKQPSMLYFAMKNNVSLMTFDNESELLKVSEIYPEARLVLRIRIVTPYKGKLDFGTKFGCSPEDITSLLQKAKELALNVVGISFHVGSNCNDERAFSAAIKQTRDAFDIAKSLGIKMNVIDIGGGFSGHCGSAKIFENICRVTNNNLDKYFPPDETLTVIAEPGRYLVASAGTIGANVVSRRKVVDVPEADNAVDGINFKMMYYINDGIYGSFLSKIVEKEEYHPVVVRKEADGQLYDSSIWGPTCDSLDLLVESIMLPIVEVGDWIYFPDMGAYTLPLSTRFNGMETPRKVYYCHRELWESLYEDPSFNYISP